MALMCRSGEEGWKTMELGSRSLRRSRMVKKGTKAFSLSGPLLEESWILVWRTPMTSKGWPSISTDSPTGG